MLWSIDTVLMEVVEQEIGIHSAGETAMQPALVGPDSPENHVSPGLPCADQD